MNIAQICIVLVWCGARAIKNKVGFVESQKIVTWFKDVTWISAH